MSVVQAHSPPIVRYLDRLNPILNIGLDDDAARTRVFGVLQQFPEEHDALTTVSRSLSPGKIEKITR